MRFLNFYKLLALLHLQLGNKRYPLKPKAHAPWLHGFCEDQVHVGVVCVVVLVYSFFWIPQHKFNWGILGDLVWSTGFQRKSKTLGNVGNLAWFAWVKLKIRLALPHTGVVLRREPRISWWGLHGANKALSTQSPPTLYWNCYCFDYLNVFCPNYVLLALSLPLVFSAAWPAQVKRWSSEQSFDGSWG